MAITTLVMVIPVDVEALLMEAAQTVRKQGKVPHVYPKVTRVLGMKK
jgi:hypothetical protein